MVEVGNIVEGKVVGITKFGAFVELEDGKKGLVHISEISNHFVKDVNEYLKVNDQVRVKVIGIAPDGKIDLSIKKVNEDRDYEAKLEKSKAVFEQKMNRFLKQSQEKLTDLKRYNDSKRKRCRRGFSLSSSVIISPLSLTTLKNPSMIRVLTFPGA